MTETMTEILKLRLSTDPGVQLDQPKTVGDKIVRVLLVKAMNGDVEAIREVWDRVEPPFFPEICHPGQPQNPPIFSAERCVGSAFPDEPLTKKFEALRQAGGNAWDAIEDPEAFLKETTGS